MAVVVAERPYWEMVRHLRDYEGTRVLWRVLLGGLLRGVLLFAPYLAALASTYLTDDVDRTVPVLLGAVLAVGVQQFVAPVVAARPWRSLVAERLWTWEKPHGGVRVPVLVHADDSGRLRRVLRKAGLNGQGGRELPEAPADAPRLTVTLDVQRPLRQGPVGDAELNEQVAWVLSAAGIRGRVAGQDV